MTSKRRTELRFHLLEKAAFESLIEQTGYTVIA